MQVAFNRKDKQEHERDPGKLLIEKTLLVVCQV